MKKCRQQKKPKAKAIRKPVAKKATKATATDTVLAIIKRSRKGVDKATLINNTGFKDNNIRAILYRLRKQGKIKSERKGIYVNA